METMKNVFMFQEVTFHSRKVKKTSFCKSFLYFEKCNFKVQSLKNFLYIRKELTKPQNKKKKVCSEEISCLFLAVKHTEIPCDYLYSTVKHKEILCDYLYSAVKHREIPCDYLYSAAQHREEIPCDYL